MNWMKLFSVLALLLTGTAFGQPPIPVVKKDSCYKQADARKKQRFPEWECGKLAGVVDCNEKLELDEGSNTVITASGKQPFSGTCETCHMNGLLERRVKFVNGKQDGIDTTKYATGCLMVIRSHVQGVENGHWTYFYDSLGTVAWEQNFSMGQKHGPQIYYSRKEKASMGDTVKFETYTNGILNGPKITYDSKGKRQKMATYVNGLLEGPFLIYNPQGQIIEELNYKQGKKNGVFKYYYDDGKLLRTENWSMDAKNGEFKTFYYDQTLQTLETYKKSSNNDPEKRMDGEVYECSTKQTAEEIYKMLNENMTAKQIREKLSEESGVNITTGKSINPDLTPGLEGKKLEGGVNKPYELKSNKKYYVVKVNRISSLAQPEVREGWFEEYYPDHKPKRRALYKKDVLIEEHVFDENGRETKTFGGEAKAGNEDDAVPTGGKKKKSKKPKKAKEPAKVEGE
jgi:antitoxin component YwqK of YwqJK toxin-antitoxin module